MWNCGSYPSFRRRLRGGSVGTPNFFRTFFPDGQIADAKSLRISDFAVRVRIRTLRGDCAGSVRVLRDLTDATSRSAVRRRIRGICTWIKEPVRGREIKIRRREEAVVANRTAHQTEMTIQEKSSGGAPPPRGCTPFSSAHRVASALAGSTTVAYEDFAAWRSHPYLEAASALPEPGDPDRYVVVLAPSWDDVAAAVDAALDVHDGIVDEFDLGAYLPLAESLPDWEVAPHVRRVRYVYPFGRIEHDHRMKRLAGEPRPSLLPS